MAQRKSKDKGESEEATVGIESDGRRKEIAVEITPRLKSRGFYFCVELLIDNKRINDILIVIMKEGYYEEGNIYDTYFFIGGFVIANQCKYKY